jgi:heptosyltransferase-2
MRIVRRIFALGGGRRDGGTLIVQPLPGIGDMIWHLPHIHSIAAADGAAVTVLTKPRSRADRLFLADVAVEDVMWLERNPGRHSGLLGIWRLARELRQRRFAQAWLLHGSSRYALALLLAGIPRTIGFGRGSQRWLLSDPVCLPPDRTHGHPITLADELLAAHRIARTEREPALRVDPAATALVSARFGDRPLPWIALGIGSSEPVKQWGAGNFAALAAALPRIAPASVFAIGGPADAAIAAALRDHCATGTRLEILTDLSIDQTAALLKKCLLYIGNDTGALNVAAAVGTAAIGLFGASPPLLHSRFIHCLQPRNGTGMTAIGVEEVLSAVEQELRQQGNVGSSA